MSPSQREPERKPKKRTSALEANRSVFSSCEDEALEFDVGRLAERLLLFDRVILRSVRYREVPTLVEAFGLAALSNLLNKGVLALDATAYSIGNFELSPLRFKVMSLIDTEPEATRRERRIALRPRLDALALSKFDRFGLMKALDRAEDDLPEDFLMRARSGVRHDVLAEIPSFHTGALLAAEEVGKKLRREDLRLRFVPDGDAGEYRADTNLIELGLTPEQAHAVARSALLAVATTEKKLEQMRVFNAITDFREAEVVMLEEKTNYVWRSNVDETPQLDRLRRVLRLKGFPDFSSAAAKRQIDFKKLLAVRGSDECAAFRKWLRTIDDESDEELQGQMNSMLPAIVAVADGAAFKLVKFALSKLSPLDLPELASDIAGTAADRATRKPFEKAKPLAFLDDAVGSILRDSS